MSALIVNEDELKEIRSSFVDETTLLPVVVQEEENKEVLM